MGEGFLGCAVLNFVAKLGWAASSTDTDTSTDTDASNNEGGETKSKNRTQKKKYKKKNKKKNNKKKQEQVTGAVLLNKHERNLTSEQEVFTLPQLLDLFDLTRVQKNMAGV